MSMKLMSLKLIPQLAGKKVLLRVDFNVPVKDGQILDNSRIQSALPTINYLKKQKAKIILISHLGEPLENKKPKIKNQKYIPKIKNQFSLRPVAKYLQKLLKQRVQFVDDCLGSKVEGVIKSMKLGEIILLENLRFNLGEKNNNSGFARQLALLADIYINEAFSVSHRAHASVSAVTNFLPSYAGFLLEKEVKALSEILEKPKHPFIVVMGGVKISTKIKVIENLAKKPARRSLGGGGADKILIGGALANNFFKAEGREVGQSIYEEEMLGLASGLLKSGKIILPIDIKIKLQAKSLKLKVEELDKLSDKSFRILDIGPETVKLFSNYLKSAKMIVWNGPMGHIEDARFAQGTKAIIKAILANKKAKIVIGGGETIAALRQFRGLTQIKTRMDADNIGVNQRRNRRKSASVFISMGGGAMLKFLEGKTLPGLKPLKS